MSRGKFGCICRHSVTTLPCDLLLITIPVSDFFASFLTLFH